MPPVVRPFNGPGALPYMINRLRRAQIAQGTQQQTTISNLEGLPVINTGAVPGMTPQGYGIQAVNPATQQMTSFYGVDGAGNAVLQFFDSSGNLVTQFDQTGMHSYDDSGVERVTIGLISSTGPLYGLATPNQQSGNMQLVTGAVFTVGTTVTGASNTADLPFTNGSVSAVIGPSTQAMVTTACEILTSGTSVEGFLAVYVDGSPEYTNAWSASAALNVTVGVPTMIGLTPGTHTFELYYKVLNPGTVTFQLPTLFVQPY